jgi:hypothetical protein
MATLSLGSRILHAVLGLVPPDRRKTQPMAGGHTSASSANLPGLLKKP